MWAKCPQSITEIHLIITFVIRLYSVFIENHPTVKVYFQYTSACSYQLIRGIMNDFKVKLSPRLLTLFLHFCLFALLQPGPACVPQHDAFLQTVDAGVLCAVLNNLARSAVSWKVNTPQQIHVYTRFIALFFSLLFTQNFLLNTLKIPKHCNTIPDRHTHP